jgi:hypothetical protein
VRIGQRLTEGKALLETDALIFRGEPRLKIPLSSIRAVEARDGLLQVDAPDGRLVFELGPEAERWAARIRNPPSLLDKLGVKAGQRVAIEQLDDPTLERQVLRRRAELVDGEDALDLLFLAVERPDDLDRLRELRKRLAPAGGIWVISPRGRPELKDTVVIAAARAAGRRHDKLDR